MPMPTETRRPFIKISIDLPVFVDRTKLQPIADAVWHNGAISMLVKPRSVEVELRPKHEDAAVVCSALVAAVMASFPEPTEGEVQGGG
jgi:hypothetical protein